MLNYVFNIFYVSPSEFLLIHMYIIGTDSTKTYLVVSGVNRSNVAFVI